MHRLSALVALQIVASLGTVAWWVYWFASGSYHHGQPCDLVYENSFPLGDLVMAGFVMTSAVQIHRRHPSALFFGFVAAGMALSLACLDTTHNLLVGGFSGPLPKILQKAVFAVVNTLVGVTTLVTLNRHRSEFTGSSGVPDGTVTPVAAGLSGLGAAVALGGIAAYAALAHDRPECAHLTEVPFVTPSVLAAAFGVGGALGLSGRPTQPMVLATGGVLAHAGLIALLYVALNPALVARPWLLAPALVVTLAVGIQVAGRGSPPT